MRYRSRGIFGLSRRVRSAIGSTFDLLFNAQ
jgi:hypothetical protein